jgi:serine-type D-Ala-D-Ala carboxypeptidase/endopeptidase
VLNRREFAAGVGSVLLAAATRVTGAQDGQAIRDVLRRRVDVEKVTVGMAVCTVTPTHKRFIAYGRERLSNEKQVTAATVFEIASITKIFTSLLLADMVRGSEVSLNDPAARHLPGDFRLPVKDGRQITLTDLATHTSGLPSFPPFPGTAFTPAWYDAVARFSMEDLKAWLNDFQPKRPADAGWEYSNMGYTLLGMALAHRAEKVFEDLLLERVVRPLDLHDTTFRPTADMQPRIAEGHDWKLNPIPPFDLGIWAAAGALRSTPRDLSRFAAAILPGSKLGIARDQEFLLTVRRAAPPIGGVQALGWEALDAPNGGSFVSKDGVSWGQAASIVLDMQKRQAIVVFSNTLPHFTKHTSPSGGGVGAADIARHLLRPSIPLEY